jgi:hypothetical protein
MEYFTGSEIRSSDNRGDKDTQKIDMVDVGEGCGRDVITMWFSVRLHAPPLTMSLLFLQYFAR